MVGRISGTLRTLGDVARVMSRDITPYVKVRLAVVLCLLVVGSALNALAPVALKRAVDVLAYAHRSAPAWVLAWVALYIGSQGLARSLGQIRGLAYARVERRLFRSLSERLFAHVMHLPLRFHLDRRTGAIGQTLDNGLEGYQLLLHHATFTIAPAAVELGTIVVILAALRQPTFVVLFSLAVISYAVMFGVSGARVARAARAAAAARVDASAAMTDGILCYETVKLFAAEPIVQKRASEALLRTEREWVGFYRRFALNGLGVAALFSLFLAATLLYAARQVQLQRMTVGDFVLVSAYMLQIVRPVEMLGFAMQGLSQGLAMLGKLLELYRYPNEGRADGLPECVALGRPLASSRPCGELKFEHVSFSYGPGRAVLTDLSFRLPPGGILGIIGVSGAGKSTLLRLLVRLLEPNSGEILLDGLRIADLPLPQLREAIAVVPQDTVLLDDTIGYNISLGRAGCTADEVERAARLARLHDWIMRQPQGYGTPVGERGVKLSGGERQRLSIARASLKQPRIYAFDEATSSLDSATEREILANLREIADSRTTLIIAHRLSTVVCADEILVLDGGRAAERGSHSELLALGGRYAALWRAQCESGAERLTAAGRATARRC